MNKNEGAPDHREVLPRPGWRKFESDEDLTNGLTMLLQRIKSEILPSEENEEVLAEKLKDRFRELGYPRDVSVHVGEAGEDGEREVKCGTNSVLTKNLIYFE